MWGWFVYGNVAAAQAKVVDREPPEGDLENCSRERSQKVHMKTFKERLHNEMFFILFEQLPKTQMKLRLI